MVQGFYSQIVAALKSANCSFVRHGKGDHEIWYSPITNRNVTVDRGAPSRYTANKIMKEAGIDRHF